MIIRLNKELTQEAMEEFHAQLEQAGAKGLRWESFKYFRGQHLLTIRQVRRILNMLPDVECDNTFGSWIYSERYWRLKRFGSERFINSDAAMTINDGKSSS